MTDPRGVVWLDIDNTLYPSSHGIADLMLQRTHAYFVSLGFSDADAHQIRSRYYKDYGLSLRGLIRYHDVDPLEFDRKCDGSLPLEDILTPDPSVRQLLEDIDRSKVRVCAITNAYINHARRVLKILQLDDLVEEIVYCDYARKDFPYKPEQQFFDEALEKVGMKDPSKCYFVDDSFQNVVGAKKLGWGSCVYYTELAPEAVPDGDTKSSGAAGGIDATIGSLEELRTVWHEIFKDPKEHGAHVDL